MTLPPRAPATDADPVGAFLPVPPEPTPSGVPGSGLTTSPTSVRVVRWVNVALGLALAVAIGGVAFAAGRMTAPQAAAAGANGRNGAGRVFAGGEFPGGFGGNGAVPGAGIGRTGAFGGGASIQGTVTAISPTSITVQTAGGQSVTIALDSTTTYHQQATATAGDVQTGGTVIVRLNVRAPTTGQTGTGGPSASDITIVPQ
ncbi:MAG TPA: hypothetical protein VKR30_11035 [Candidatus Limnocylindrales bacterium]|nr:hypothetical protein [Candidatus Limnocylindrales bacterium]